jgi:predicted extracellular nuclease
VGDTGAITVASFNVENLDPGDGARFGALAQQIVTNLRSPDILALQEIQDNDGQTNSAITSASQTLQQLADAIAAAGGPTYLVLDNPFIGDDTNGGAPGGNIRTAYLYNPARVTLVTNSIDTVTNPLDQQTNPANPFFSSRLPLVATFEAGNERFTLINNHLSSKGGSDPLFGTTQPPANGGLADRIAQAQEVADYVDGLFAADPDGRFIVLGDMNEFWFYDPLLILEDAGLYNLHRTLPEAERYSYVFEGNSQALDHILVSNNLRNRTSFDAVHINAEFGGDVSDHDPLIARISFASTVATPAPPAAWVLVVGLIGLAATRRRV